MLKLLASLFSNLSLAAVFAAGTMLVMIEGFAKDLPSQDTLRDYRPKMLSRVYSGEGDVIAEFAKQRRVFVPIDEVPFIVKAAFISAEDKNFYSHPGVDALGIVKAIGRFAQAKMTGRAARLSGASTITQQVMKNFLVGDERSIERKIKEGILAVRVEKTFTKDQILELYLNDISFGLRAHGIVAAAENYYGKTVDALLPHEAAYLAALPKGPNNYHPIHNRERAIGRRNYVLKEMAENGWLDPVESKRFAAMPLGTLVAENRPLLIQRKKLSYFTSEVRRQLIQDVGWDTLYHGGLTVRATVDDELQAMATRALRRGLERFDRGQGTYRGPLTNLPRIVEGDAWRPMLARLSGRKAPRDIKGWSPAVVLEVGEKTAIVGVEGTDEALEGRAPGEVALRLSRERQWIRRRKTESGKNVRVSKTTDLWSVGDVVLVKREKKGWSMRQVPEIQGGFMAMDPHSGRVLALQGGFSYDHSPFNRATQAERQPGSSFKPFVFAAALDIGYTPQTIVNDAPIKIGSGRKAWKPKNSTGRTYGPVSLRKALEQSLNLVTVRLAIDIGMDRVGEYAERFGVYENMPNKLSYSLGSGETTLYKVVAAYGMFANGGKRVEPTLIDRIQDRSGNTLFRHDPRVCQGCTVETFGKERTPILFDGRSQIMDPKTASNLTSMMRGVITRGTAKKTVRGLGFPVAGKTGTTNDNKDAWFVGYSRNLVAGCFMGYDTPRKMGRRAYGGTLCGPIFKEFMRRAHSKFKPGSFSPPRVSGSRVTIKVHAETGERLPSNATGPHVLVKTYQLGVEPEILVADKRQIKDAAIFKKAVKNKLISTLPEGEDVPLAKSLPKRTKKNKSGKRVKRKPKNVGLGTGGLY